MASRFYLLFQGAVQANYAPAFAAGWDISTDTFRNIMVLTKDGNSSSATAVGDRTQQKGTTLQPSNRLVAAFYSDPLAQQTIAGTVKSIIRGVTNSANANAQMIIRVIGADGVTVRGTLFDFDNSAISNAFTTTRTNRKFPKNWTAPGATLTPVDALTGDRIAVEVGYRDFDATLAVSSGVCITQIIGVGTDNAENETGTTNSWAWIEFSQNLTFTTLIPSTDHYLMSWADVDSGTQPIYRTWQVLNQPDPSGLSYSGPKSGATPILSASIAAKWSTTS